MTKLKTLEDIKEGGDYPKGDLYGTGARIALVELREEAIKHIKRLREEAKGTEWSFFYHTVDGEWPTIQWIKYFFNITEEDLK